MSSGPLTFECVACAQVTARDLPGLNAKTEGTLSTRAQAQPKHHAAAGIQARESLTIG
jgi:hypothetical protein